MFTARQESEDGTVASKEENLTGLGGRADELYRTYLQSTSTNISLSTTIQRLIDRTDLTPSDIVDYGRGASEIRPRFMLRPALKDMVVSATRELQGLLAALAEEVPRRCGQNDYYYIDPDDNSRFY